MFRRYVFVAALAASGAISHELPHYENDQPERSAELCLPAVWGVLITT